MARSKAFRSWTWDANTRPCEAEILAALGRVCDSGGFVLGSEVTQLEQQLAVYCQAKHAIGCASGSDALLLALMALDISAGDEVILPSFTFFATASAVTRLGARPVFADIDPQTFNIDPEHVASLVTPSHEGHHPRALVRTGRRHRGLGQDCPAARHRAGGRRRPGDRRGNPGPPRGLDRRRSAVSVSIRRRISAGPATAAC